MDWQSAGLFVCCLSMQVLMLYIINIMSAIFLLLFVATVNSQILKQVEITLEQLNEVNITLDIYETRAINHLFQTHPELSNYTVTKIHSKLNRGDQTYSSNLKDFLFELVSDQQKIRALVTVSNDPKRTYVTLSPIVSSNPPAGNAKYKNFAEYSFFLEYGLKSKEAINSPIMNQPIQSNYNSPKNAAADQNLASSTERPPLNSYIEYMNNQDPIVQFALDFVASEHPNIVNYDSKSVSYQLVAGLNIKIHYVGDDQFTKVNAIVNFDMKLKPKIIRFEVECVLDDGICNSMAAWSVYQSLESILIFHPQLFAYRIVDFAVRETPPGRNKLRVMITFQNQNKTRTLIDGQIGPAKATILSLYSYSYEQ